MTDSVYLEGKHFHVIQLSPSWFIAIEINFYEGNLCSRDTEDSENVTVPGNENDDQRYKNTVDWKSIRSTNLPQPLFGSSKRGWAKLCDILQFLSFLGAP
jgi:hypothetical protein